MGASGVMHDEFKREIHWQEKPWIPPYQQMADYALDLIGVINRDGTLVYVSPSSRAVYGCEPEALVGRRAFDHALPEDRPAVWHAFKHAIRTKQPIRFEYRYERGNQCLIMEARGNPVLRPDGKIDQVVLIIRDITSRKRVEQRLYHQNQLLERIARAEPLREVLQTLAEDFVEDTQLMCAINCVNDMSSSVCHPPELLFSVQHKVIWSRPILSVNGRIQGTMTVYSSAEAVSTDDTEQVFESYLNLAGLAIERKYYEQEVRQLAYQDSLTGLPNRRLVSERIEYALGQARETGQQVGVLMLDLDRFKSINDSFGHAFGDDLLKVVAERLRSSIPAYATLGRIGGDEFIVLMPEIADLEVAADAANRILQAFVPPVVIDGHEFRIMPSIGVAVYPEHGKDLNTIFRNADTAMYAAKRDGRYPYCVYQPLMSEGLHQRLLMESYLQKALERNEFQFYYQPRFRQEDSHLTGVEALIRWQHPVLGMVSPADFVPLAEDTGLIIPIGDFVLRTVCRQIRTWMDEGVEPMRVAANVSGHQLTQADFAGYVQRLLRESGADPTWLELEITESALILQAEQTIEDIAVLRAIGVMVSIDDFGTGYSSLRRLANLPVDTLKIDKSFVEDIPYNKDNLAITDTIIALARNLGLHVVAEGVETPEQREALRTLGCDEMQGYLFGRPMPLADITSLLHCTTVNEV
jgi:diguanylate cyclase (GGDEF)-like protein/PAS domain S-box-containing protein